MEVGFFVRLIDVLVTFGFAKCLFVRRPSCPILCLFWGRLPWFYLFLCGNFFFVCGYVVVLCALLCVCALLLLLLCVRCCWCEGGLCVDMCVFLVCAVVVVLCLLFGDVVMCALVGFDDCLFACCVSVGCACVELWLRVGVCGFGCVA